MPSKVPIAAAIVGSIVVIGALLILVFYQGTDKVVLVGLYVTVIVAVFGYLQSATNTSALAVIAPQVKQAVETVAAVDVKVDSAVEVVETTHKIVNNELTKWKQGVVDDAEKDRLLWEERSKKLIADALATGLARGRELAVQEAQDTAVAVVAAAVPAESVTEAADKVIQVAAAAADKVTATATEAAATLAASTTAPAPHDVEPGADGVLSATAPVP